MARLVQYSTIENYLSAIKYYHFSHSYALNLSAFLRLQLIVRRIKRSQGVNSKARRPITFPKLIFLPSPKCPIYHQQRFLNGLRSNDTCLFSFIRIGELTCDSHFNPDRHLTISDLVCMPKSSSKYYYLICWFD